MKAGLSTGSKCTLATRRSGGEHQEGWTAMVQCKPGDPPDWRPALSRWPLTCNGRTAAMRFRKQALVVSSCLHCCDYFGGFFFTAAGSFQVLSTTCPYKRQLWILYALEKLRLTEELGSDAASRCWTKCYFLLFRMRKETFSPPFFFGCRGMQTFLNVFHQNDFHS